MRVLAVCVRSHRPLRSALLHRPILADDVVVADARPPLPLVTCVDLCRRGCPRIFVRRTFHPRCSFPNHRKVFGIATLGCEPCDVFQIKQEVMRHLVHEGRLIRRLHERDQTVHTAVRGGDIALSPRFSSAGCARVSTSLIAEGSGSPFSSTISEQSLTESKKSATL